MLIHKELTATVEGLSIPAQLSWSDTNPLAVAMNLYDASRQGWVEWVFAFDLLAQGLSTAGLPVGAGDVTVESILDEYVIRMTSPEGIATVSLSWELVSHFGARIVTEFSAEDEARAVALQVDTFLRDLSLEAF